MRGQVTRAGLGLAFALAMLVRLADPAPIQAAGPCAITVEPDTVRVGEAFVITATGFEPNEMAIGLGALDSGGSAALGIQLDATGSLTQTVTAKTFMIGTQSVNMLGDVSNCVASASLTVLPALGVPATDTVPATWQRGSDVAPSILAVVWGLTALGSCAVLRRRTTPN